MPDTSTSSMVVAALLAMTNDGTRRWQIGAFNCSGYRWMDIAWDLLGYETEENGMILIEACFNKEREAWCVNISNTYIISLILCQKFWAFNWIPSLEPRQSSVWPSWRPERETDRAILITDPLTFCHLVPSEEKTIFCQLAIIIYFARFRSGRVNCKLVIQDCSEQSDAEFAMKTTSYLQEQVMPPPLSCSSLAAPPK